MTQFLKLVLILGMLTQGVAAALPKNPSINEYKLLLARSPFIIKKFVETKPKPVINSSLTLRGVSMFDDGWFVTVVDRKAPQTRIFLREGAPTNTQGIRLLKVSKNNDDYMKTTVTLMTGGQQVTVAYNSADIKKSISKATKASKATSRPAKRRTTSNRPPIPSASKKSPVPTAGSSQRRPRVRRTPTPPVPRTK